MTTLHYSIYVTILFIRNRIQKAIDGRKKEIGKLCLFLASILQQQSAFQMLCYSYIYVDQEWF